MSFGIQKVGDPSTFMSWSHWTREDAQRAAEYNSARWGEHEVWTDVTRKQLTGDQFEFVDAWHESQEAGCCDIDGPYCADSIADLVATQGDQP